MSLIYCLMTVKSGKPLLLHASKYRFFIHKAKAKLKRDAPFLDTWVDSIEVEKP